MIYKDKEFSTADLDRNAHFLCACLRPMYKNGLAPETKSVFLRTL